MDVKRRINYFVEGFRTGLSPRIVVLGLNSQVQTFVPLGSVFCNLSYVTSMSDYTVVVR